MKNKFAITGNRSFLNLIGVLVGLIFFAGLMLAFFQRNHNNNAQRLVNTYEKMSITEERIDDYFQGTSSALLSLTFSVDRNTGAVQNFDSIASKILETNKKIDMLSLLPGGTIMFVYPKAGNEGLLGKNILTTQDYSIKLDAFETQKSKQLKFSGPYKNFVGDSVVAARLPIYIKGNFWGFAVVTYKFSNFISKLGFNKKTSEGYDFGLSKTAPGTLNETFFYNNKDKVSGHIYSTMKIDRLGWNLYTIHTSSPASSITILQLLFCIIASAVVGYFIASLLKRPEVLKSHIQKQAMQLSSSEMRFEQFFENAPVGLAVLDYKTRFITEANKKFCTLLGKDRSYALSGIKFSDFVPNDIYFSALQEFQNTLSGKQTNVYRQYKHQRPDGSVSWIDVTITPLFDANNYTNQLLLLAEDITDEKLAMEELENSEEQFKDLFEESPIGKWEEDFSDAVSYLEELGLMGKNKETVIKYFNIHPKEILKTFSKIKILNVNKAVLRLHQTDDKDDLINNPQKYLNTPKALEAFNELFACLCSGETLSEHETQIYTATGELRDTLIKWHTISGGKKKYSHVIVAVDDITNTKIIFEELKRSEEKFKNLFNESPVAKWEEDFSEVAAYLESLGLIGKDKNQILEYFDKHPQQVGIAFSKVKIINVNKAVLDQHRVTSSEELFSNTEKLIVTPKGAKVIKNILVALCQRETSGEYESQIYTMDGQLRDTILKWHILPGGKTEYSQMIVATEDITVRKKALEDLEDARARLQTIINTIDGIVWAADPETKKINFVSDNVKEITGFEKEEILGIELFTNKSIDSHDKIRGSEIFQFNFNNLTPHSIEYKIITKSGETKWFKESISFLKDGEKIDAILGIMVDITELKQSQTQLQNTNARLQLIIDNIDGVIWTAEPDTFNYTSISNKAEELTGYKASEWINKPTFCNLSLHPDDSGNIMPECRNKVQMGLPHDLEYRMFTKNGQMKWIRESIDYIRDKNGKIQSIIGILVDLTDISQSKIALQQSLDLLMEQNKRLKNFSYIVSHNLRSHTGNIQSLCDLIQTSDDDDEKDLLLTHVGEIANILHNTMEGLNEVVRIQENTDITKEKLNLNKYIKHALEILGDRIKQKNIKIINNIDDSININYNKSYLESILLNFISNAIKYSDPKRNSFVEINYIFEHNETVLEISDNGIGIDMKLNGPKLFGLFKTFTSNTDSKGVGLYISKNQIESMGGRVTVESELNVGTKFKIYIK